MAQRGRALWVAAVLLALCVVGFAAAGPAGAGDSPYGPMTTDPPQGVPFAQPTCGLSITGGASGDEGTATVTDVPAGMLVRILIGGLEAGRSTAPAGPGVTATVVVPFRVPDLEAGRYLVSAVGPTFSAECDAAFEVSEVGGVVVENPGSTDGADGGGSTGAPDGTSVGGSTESAGPLPKTGIYAALLVAIAIALLTVGRTAMAASRRQKRRAWAEANRVQVLTRSDVGPRP